MDYPKVKVCLDTSEDNLIDELYTPCLKWAERFDRGVGYFTTGWLTYNVAGLSDLALRKILCKRYSTNVKNSAVSCACAGLNSLGRRSPGRALQYARPQGVNAARASPGSLQPGNQPALRSANMISNWLRIRSQFWHRACQCFTIR